MYKVLLCWRYLLTRYLALACVVSVMLGVATLIVVNSVMSGFSTKLRARLHGLLSDVVVDASGQSALLQNRFKLRVWDPVLNKGAIWTYWRGAYRDAGKDEGATIVTGASSC